VGGRDGYLTLPLGDVDESVVTEVHQALVPPGPGIDRFDVPGWPSLPTDVSWVPGLAPTVVRHYSDGDAATVDLYSVAGDIGGAMAMVALLPEATPYPVSGAMGWQAPLSDGQTLFVWQAAPGTVGMIVASEAAEPDVGAMIGSIPAPAPVGGEHPNARLVGRSAEGDVPWVVEALDYLPTGGPSAADNRDCVGLWVGGQAPMTSCGTEIPPELSYFRNFSAVTQVGDDTVVFAEVAPAVAAVGTDAPGAEHATVETQPIDPTRPDSLRYAVLIVHGDRDEPQTFRLLGAGGEELYTTEFDLNEVGG
jgi:hypothetical protein